MTSLLIKESVNQAVDAMGFTTALSGAFTLHQLNHAHWRDVNDDGYPVAKPGESIDDWRTAGPPKPVAQGRTLSSGRAEPEPVEQPLAR